MLGSWNVSAFLLLTKSLISTLHAETFVVVHESALHRHAISSQHRLLLKSTSTPSLSLQQRPKKQHLLWSRQDHHCCNNSRNTRHHLRCHLDIGGVGNAATKGRLAGLIRRRTKHHRQYGVGEISITSSRQQRNMRGRSQLVMRLAEEGLPGREGVLGGAAGGGGEESNALLLRVDFEDAEVEELRQWIRRYPFGTTLPVQPFSLVVTKMGVDVVFRKKPTLERGSQDGGLSFVVEEGGRERDPDLSTGPTLVMRRISEGQEIRKMFAERIVVKAVVRSLAGRGNPPAPEGVKVRMVLHEGLV